MYLFIYLLREVKADTGKRSKVSERVKDSHQPSISATKTAASDSQNIYLLHRYLLSEGNTDASKGGQISKTATERFYSCISNI